MLEPIEEKMIFQKTEMQRGKGMLRREFGLVAQPKVVAEHDPIGARVDRFAGEVKPCRSEISSDASSCPWR